MRVMAEGWANAGSGTPLLVEQSDYQGRSILCLDPQADVLRVRPALAGPVATTRPVLTGAGEFALCERVSWNPTEPPDRKFRWEGIVRVAVGSGETIRVHYERNPENILHTLRFGGSPDGSRVAIIQPEVTVAANQTPQPSDHWFRLILADLTGTAAREVAQVQGSPYETDDTIAVQWSPDGTSIAASLVRFSEDRYPTLQVALVTAGGDPPLRMVHGYALSGSRSWSEDGERLLVEDMERNLWLLQLSTGAVVPVPLVRDTAKHVTSNGWPRVIGFADEDHLLVARRRGKTMVLSRYALTTGDDTPVLRWTAPEASYPVLPPGSTDFWSSTTAG